MSPPPGAPEEQGYWMNKSLGVIGWLPTDMTSRKRDTKEMGAGQGYRGTTAKSEENRDGQMAVVAEHSTDDLGKRKTESGRWGTETQRTH